MMKLQPVSNEYILKTGLYTVFLLARQVPSKGPSSTAFAFQYQSLENCSVSLLGGGGGGLERGVKSGILNEKRKEACISCWAC